MSLAPMSRRPRVAFLHLLSQIFAVPCSSSARAQTFSSGIIVRQDAKSRFFRFSLASFALCARYPDKRRRSLRVPSAYS